MTFYSHPVDQLLMMIWVSGNCWWEHKWEKLWKTERMGTDTRMFEAAFP